MAEATTYTDNMLVRSSVMKALHYYALFYYPLRANEVYGNMAVSCSFTSVLTALDDLEREKYIYGYDGYYSADKDIINLVERRKEANRLAEIKNRQAIKVGRLIFQFPFVRFAGISGSLSKGYADKKSDFDFFIITDKNRLWICRTLLHVFKKLTFFFGQEHKFCMNYFIDLYNLELEEKNNFTAIELASLIPAEGRDVYGQLNTCNKWVHTFLPNNYVKFNAGNEALGNKDSIGKRLSEGLINLFAPEQLNRALMHVTDKKWRKKWAKRSYSPGDYELAFKTTLHVSKNHPANHQKRILDAISKFEDKKINADVVTP